MDYIFGFILSGLIGAVCGQFKGRVVTGFILGLLLGPIGWCIVLLLKKARSGLDFYEKEEARAEGRKVRPPAPDTKWRIARGTTDLGEKDVAGIKLMLSEPEAASANYQFFDANKGEWVSIYAHPALAPRRVSTKRPPSSVRYEV